MVLDELVRPDHTIIDYNTTFSGITAEQLETATHTLDTVCGDDNIETGNTAEDSGETDRKRQRQAKTVNSCSTITENY